MDDIKSISWQELTGNKYSRALHPAMLSDEGYVYTMRVRRTGEAKPSAFRVTYDKQYVVEFLAKRLLNPLSNQSRETIDKLIEDAWDWSYEAGVSPHVLNRINN